MNIPFLRQASVALLLALLTLSAFYPGLSGSFLFDDFPNIVTNPRVHAETLDAETLRSASRAYEPGAFGRPLATISFAIDHAIAGLDARQFKRTSLAVHLVNALLVLLLVSQLLRTRASPGAGTLLAAFTISLLWAIHPLQVSTVHYVVQRMEMLSVTFMLAGLCCYVAGRTRQISGRGGWHFLVASTLMAAVGFLGKETALLFPAYTLALELSLFHFDSRKPRTAAAWRIGYLAATIVGLSLFFIVILPDYLDPSIYSFRDFTLAERLLTQLRVLPMYLGWIVLPLPNELLFYYDNYVISRGLLSPWTTLAGGLLLMALLAVAFRLRNRLPFAFLGVLWFFASHLLTSNVFPLELVFEHRNYFSVLAIALVAYDMIRAIPVRDGPAILRAGVGLIILFFGVLTLIRSATWGEPLLLASDMVAKNPGSARASNDLGEQYMVLAARSTDSPFYAMAEAEFERGSRLPGASPLPEQALILLAATAGAPPKTEWWDRVDHKLRAGAVGPEESVAIMGLLKQRYDGIPLDDERLGQALGILFSRQQMPPVAYAQYGDFALDYLNDDELASRLFVEAISAPPRDPKYVLQIIAVLAADNHSVQAEAVVERAIELGLLEPGMKTSAPDRH